MTRVQLIALLFMVTPGVAHAVDGVTNDSILFGQSCALSGPSQESGRAVAHGLEIAFASVNARGGVDGRRIELITRDDGYDPERARLQVERLVDEDHVFALIGNLGTPTSLAVLPLLSNRGIPLIGPVTGSEALRDPLTRVVINIRPGYAAEAERVVGHLVDVTGCARVACLHQRGADVGRAGTERALANRGLELVAIGDYAANANGIRQGLLHIRRGRPDGIMLAATNEAAVNFITLSQAVGSHDVHYGCISYVDAAFLYQRLGSASDGIVLARVVPHLTPDAPEPLVRQFRADLAAYIEAQGLINSDGAAVINESAFMLEGYLVGRFTCAVLEGLTGLPTRSGFIDAVEQRRRFDVAGVELRFSPTDHQGSDTVHLSVVRGGVAVPVEQTTDPR